MNLTAWMKCHRWAGFGIAVFIALSCVTGILLNHGDALGLHRTFVHNGWLLDLYGIRPPRDVVSFQSGGHWVSRIGDRLYFDDRELGERSGELVGAVLLGDQIIVGLSERLLILTPDGATVELLRGAEGVPAGMHRIGVAAGNRLVIDAAHGRYIPDLDTLRWEESEVSGVNWAEPMALPAGLGKKLLHRVRSRTLTLERVLQDVHSGRIVSRFGVWFMDFVAVVLVSLVVSGLWIWYRR